jgi:hypothetical protein
LLFVHVDALSTVQWMGSAGIAKPEIRSVAQNVVDSLYALDEDCLGFHDPAEETLSGLRTGGKLLNICMQ